MNALTRKELIFEISNRLKVLNHLRAGIPTATRLRFLPPEKVPEYRAYLKQERLELMGILYQLLNRPPSPSEAKAWAYRLEWGTAPPRKKKSRPVSPPKKKRKWYGPHRPPKPKRPRGY